MESSTKHTFANSLRNLKKLTQEKSKVKIEELFNCLTGRGSAALIILLSFPFCFPLPLPGISTPFGLILSFIGLRLAFGKKLWWPRWVLNKEFSSKSIAKITDKLIHFFNEKKGFVRPRLTFLTHHPLLHRLDGVIVAILGLFLALPLPIPLTNLFSAIPLLFIGIGLLEDDGLFILMAYVIASICVAFFIFLFIFGKSFF